MHIVCCCLFYPLLAAPRLLEVEQFKLIPDFGSWHQLVQFDLAVALLVDGNAMALVNHELRATLEVPLVRAEYCAAYSSILST